MEARVEIRSMAEVTPVPLPGLTGVAADAGVQTRPMITNAKALYLWLHEMAPGGTLRFAAPPVGHVLYAWKGSVTVDGAPVGTEQTVVVEHRAAAPVVAGPEGATLAHFHQSEATPHLTERAGGHVHTAPADDLFARIDDQRRAVHKVWGDAHCPTCELWLHRSSFALECAQGEPHLHNEDEIIFVVDGGIKVGKVHPPGTAIAVAADAVYTFGVDPQGGAFINFRPTNPLVKFAANGKPVGEWVSERRFMRNELTVDVIDPRAQLPTG